MDDWHDPFADDEAARERERRRAEREARRAERRRALADRVRAEAPPAERPAVPPAERPAPPPRSTPQHSAPPAPPARPPRAATLETTVPPPAEDPAPASTAEPAPPQGARGLAGRASLERQRLQSRLTRRLPRRPGRLPDDLLWRRRLIGLAIVVALGALVVYGATKVLDRLGGSDDPAPPPAAETVSVTIPEGLPRAQIAPILKDAGVRGNYVKATRRFKGFDPGRYGASDPRSLEGFLFPATYELPKNARVEDLVERQLAAFRENVARVKFGYAKSKNLTKYDVLTIASMVEREVQVPEERRQVAAVIYNRLAAGNPLGIDATIRYEDQNFDQQLTESRLNEPTPYNTRQVPGLPPTPIGNPGLASIKAAANPARNDNFYFVVKPGTCGEHFFTPSEEEFRAASERYQRALEEKGGSPTLDESEC